MIHFNAHPLEVSDIAVGAFPTTLSSPINGRWCCVQSWYGVLVVIMKTAGQTGRNTSLELRQARNEEALDAKPLEVDGYDVKTATTLTRARWVRYRELGSTMTPPLAGDEEALAGVWVPSASLDPGFLWLQARYRFNPRMQDRNQVMGFFYMGFAPRHGGRNRTGL